MEEFHKQPTLPGVAPKAAPEEPVPDQIGPYRIEGLLNRGGMSRLYLGVHPETHDPLVIKVLLPQFLAHPELKQRFLREARIIQMTDHPNIITLFDEGEWESGLYIAMEFIQGMSLRQFILQHSMSLRRSCEILLQIASALEHLHSHGVIHRDLKPENILLTSSGGIKVIDFGIAQLGSNGARLAPGQMMGTPVYMSPEQKRDPLSVTFASDIYSLAIVAYELLLGKISHGQIHLSLMPKGIQPILTKALQPEPSERYQNVSDFIRDLSTYLASDALEQDQRGRGYAQDIAQHLRQAQATMLPPRPDWPGVSLGVAMHQDYSVAGLYYDFLDLGEGAYGIVLSEPSSRGVSGTMHAALLQGLLHGLGHSIQDPVTLIESVNRLLGANSFEEIFTLHYLILWPRQRKLEYLSCGYGPLYMLHSPTQTIERVTTQNLALGIDPSQSFVAVQHNWDVGDGLVLTTFRAGASQEQEFEQALQESFYAPPQKQAEAVLRRVLHAMETEPELRPITVITVQNQG